MGVEESKSVPPLTKTHFEIVCMSIFHYSDVERDRQIATIMKSDTELLNQLNCEYKNKQAINDQLNTSASIFKKISAINCLKTNIKVLQDHSIQIITAANKRQEPTELMGYIHSVVYCHKHLNLECIGDFNKIVLTYFDPKIRANIDASP